MDFSKFSDENFEVKDWVNSALRIREERTPVDVSFDLVIIFLTSFTFLQSLNYSTN